MKVKAIKDYPDKERGIVLAGDSFEVSDERATILINAGAVEKFGGRYSNRYEQEETN